MKKILIVGQGLAGSVLRSVFALRGAEVYVAEAGFPNSATLAAAGVINPVTGKRYATSWRYDDFFPVAKRMFIDLQGRYNDYFWFDRPIIRLLSTVEEANTWSTRCGWPSHRPFLEESADGGDWKDSLRPGFFYGRIQQAAQVHMPNFIRSVRSYQKNVFADRKIEAAAYGELLRDYDLIITCEGHRGSENPYFRHLPWDNNKGEALLISLPEASHWCRHGTLKKKIMVTHMYGNYYWAGSPYQWDFTDDAPSAEGRLFIEQELKSMLTVPFEVVDHVAGIRPSVKDRRPFLGFSPENPRIGIFNGLGTKGALLAPYWAEHLADHILQGIPLDPEVDIRRYAQP